MAASHYYYLEIENWGGGEGYAEVAVEFNFWPGEKRVMYDRNGDGYPGSPAEIEIIGATVIYLESEGCKFHSRAEMGDQVKALDEMAMEYVDDLDLYNECLDCVCN